MIILLEPDSGADVVATVENVARQHRGITVKTQVIAGERHTVTEIYLLGPTSEVETDAFSHLPGVASVVRVSRKYRMIGRHAEDDNTTTGFEVDGVKFDGKSFHLFAGLCAVDQRDHVDQTMAAVAKLGLVTTRMGAYKPRTSPYDFQGRGESCLPYVFELAGKHGIKIVAMEVTSPAQIDEIHRALDAAGKPTTVMLQIGTRNAQNFELLKATGQQSLPVLFKRGMGITLEESLNAVEYIASEGNPRIVFCLRGVKSHLGDPHRNLVDFGHVPVVSRLTRLPVCVDPSHSVGRPDRTTDGIPDILHVLGQGIVAGATMGLVDVHPHPEVALCDGPQALTLPQIPWLKAHCDIMREAYEKARALAESNAA